MLILLTDVLLLLENMKRTFRIIEQKYSSGTTYFYVQQKWLGTWWKPSGKYDSLVRSVWDGVEYKKFETIDQVKEALEKVKEVLRNYRDSYKKVVEVVHIEV